LNSIEAFKTGSAIPLFLLDNPFSGFAQNPFEKLQADICHFSKDFCAKLTNLSTNRKKGNKNSKENSAPTHFLQKLLVNSKGFGVERLTINNFNIVLKEQLI
jgi:hypothetical protein